MWFTPPPRFLVESPALLFLWGRGGGGSGPCASLLASFWRPLFGSAVQMSTLQNAMRNEE